MDWSASISTKTNCAEMYLLPNKGNPRLSLIECDGGTEVFAQAQDSTRGVASPIPLMANAEKSSTCMWKHKHLPLNSAD